MIFIYLWKNFGYNTILYYATLIGIDDSYYEAAVIDGASTWQQIRHITLPCLKTTIITLTIMAIGRMFYSDFGLFYQVPMSNGLLFDATQTIDTYVFRALIQSTTWAALCRRFPAVHSGLCAGAGRQPGREKSGQGQRAVLIYRKRVNYK